MNVPQRLSSDARKGTDSLAVHDSLISSTVREERIRRVHEWYRLGRHVSTSQLNAIESTMGSVEDWLTGLVAPSSHEQGKRSIIVGKVAFLTGTKTKLQIKSTSLTVIVANVVG